MKSYVINLYRAHKRRQSVIQEFEKQQIPYELVFGVDNNQLQLLKPRVPISTGAVGAFLSHTQVLQNALNQSDDIVFVAEDDVQLGENFISRLNESLAIAPADWDVIFLGWEKGKKGKELLGKKGSKWIQVKNALGVYAYLVKKSSIPKILSKLSNITNHIDKQLVSAIESGSIKAYWRREKLVTCHDFPSQIEK